MGLPKEADVDSTLSWSSRQTQPDQHRNFQEASFPIADEVARTVNLRSIFVVYTLPLWLITVMLCSLCAICSPAQANPGMMPLAIEELAESSELVVRAKVLSKQVQMDESQRIYTRIEVQILETWKGNHPEAKPLTIVHGGGKLNGRTTVVSSQVRYQVGEEMVAFLRFNERREAVTVALAQGKFEIIKDMDSGKQFVRNPFFGGSPRSESDINKARIPTQLPLTIGDLKNRVQSTHR